MTGTWYGLQGKNDHMGPSLQKGKSSSSNIPWEKGYLSSQEQYVYRSEFTIKNQPSHGSVNIPTFLSHEYGMDIPHFFVGQSKVKSTHWHHLWGLLKQVAVSNKALKIEWIEGKTMGKCEMQQKMKTQTNTI